MIDIHIIIFKSMKVKKTRSSNIPKPFADGTMTNSAFFSMLRAMMRQKSRWWTPITVCKNRVKIPYAGTNKRKKWVYRCEDCGALKSADEIFVHHIHECGTLTSFEDIPGFAKRLFCNSDELVAICEKCHDIRHNKIKKK